MKTQFYKLLLILCILLHSTNNLHAQVEKKPAFDVGSSSLGISLGLGTNYYYDDFDYYYSYSRPTALPSFALTYDQGVAKAGPGVIGVGGILSIRSASYKYSSQYKATYRNVVIGVRGTYHLSVLKNKNNKFDPYGGMTLGLRLHSYKDNYYEERYSSSHAVVGIFIGAKYNFSQRFGVFSELGYDVSLFRFGLCLNF